MGGSPDEVAVESVTGKGGTIMTTASGSAFTMVFDCHVADICENMNKLSADTQLYAGLAVQDDEHDRIFRAYNDVIACLQDADKVDQSAVKFEQLISYVALQFIIENKVMKMLGYPACETHTKQHADFIARINEFVREVEAGQATIADMVHYIGHWLLGHVLLVDREFGDYQASLPTSRHCA